MLVDLRAEALTTEQILRWEHGGVTLELSLFLGAVDASGDTFEDGVYRDSMIENHVESVSLNLVSDRLYRVVIRAPEFFVYPTGDPFGRGELRYVSLRFADSSVARWLRQRCGTGGRGEPNARVIDGESRWWDVDNALLTSEE